MTVIVAAGSIIKKNVVRQAPPKPLQTSDAAATECASTHAGGTVRLIQQTPAGALLEITCGCGKTTRVNCLYAGGAASPAAAGN